mgnify:FL=1
MLRKLLFDLDNTLLDFDKAERLALTKALSALSLEPTDHMLDRYNKINLAQWKLLEKGELDREAVKKRRFLLLFEEFGIDREAEEAARLYEGFLGEGHYFMDYAEELLQKLSGEYQIYIATNGTAHVQKGRIASAGIRDYVEDVFISEEIGVNKPSKEYFDRCFERIPDFDRNEAVVIGDSLTSDILGGINAGVRTIWFHKEGEENGTGIIPDYEITDLRELPDLLKKL